MALCHRGRRSGAVSTGGGVALCLRGGVALWRERRSGAVTPGRRLCKLIVTAKLVKKNYVKEERKRYFRYTDNSFMCK